MSRQRALPERKKAWQTGRRLQQRDILRDAHWRIWPSQQQFQLLARPGRDKWRRPRINTRLPSPNLALGH